MAKNKHVLVRSKLSTPEENKGITVEQDKTDPIRENVENTMAPTVVDQGIQNNESQVVDNDVSSTEITETTVQESSVVSEVIPVQPPVVQPVAVTVAPEPSKINPKSPEVISTSAPTASDFTQTVSKLKANGSKAEKDLINNLENYMAKMKPGLPVEVEKGAQNQHQLWKTISGLVENAPLEEFRKLWSILLTYFHEHRNDVFHQRYVFRFAEYWRHGEPSLNGLQRIVNVIQLTADPAERKHGLRQVSLERSLADGFSEEARQRIISFYN